MSTATGVCGNCHQLRHIKARGLCDGCYNGAREAGELARYDIEPPRARFAFVPADWTVEALCAQTDPEEFFPEKGGTTRHAKAVCRRCEVRTECLTYALENQERFGIWGGHSPRERRALSRNLGLVS